ncbi:MAG: hypothetical protein ACOC44_17940, partial [Promethearchaeia archaeon]
MKSKNKKILNLLLLGILFSTFLFHFDNNNNNNNVNYARNTDHNDVSENANTDRLKSQSINQDNSYSGIGEPWNVTHYANQTDHNPGIQFENGTTDSAEVPLLGWEGYKHESNIFNLHDSRNWNWGSFENDPYDNSIQNWSFSSVGSNSMSGNWDTAGGRDCIELKMDASGNNDMYYEGSKGGWNTSLSVPRGKVID